MQAFVFFSQPNVSRNNGRFPPAVIPSWESAQRGSWGPRDHSTACGFMNDIHDLGLLMFLSALHNPMAVYNGLVYRDRSKHSSPLSLRLVG